MKKWKLINENIALIYFVIGKYSTQINGFTSVYYTIEDFTNDFIIYLSEELHKFDEKRGKLSVFINYKLTSFINRKYVYTFSQKRYNPNNINLDCEIEKTTVANFVGYNEDKDYNLIVSEYEELIKSKVEKEKELYIKIFHLMIEGHTQQSTSEVLQISQPSVSRKIREIKKIIKESL